MPKSSTSRTRKSLLVATALPAAAFAGGFAADLSAVPQARFVAAAHAQSNPCAPAAQNPCAPAAANPCAPAATNPCAPAAKPAKSAMPANPCAAAAVTTAAANPYAIETKGVQAPYGDVMPEIVNNYLRAAPYVGTGGVIAEGGFPKLAELGFKTVINLNTEEEGAVAEGEQAKAAGLNYISLAVPTKAPTAEQVAEFSTYVNDPANYPVLVHCESSNRVGAMWALYRAANGVPPMIAIQEGRTVGLKTSREDAVRAAMGISG
jgi:uncharacterized protein (TIGR01244 family)